MKNSLNLPEEVCKACVCEKDGKTYLTSFGAFLAVFVIQSCLRVAFEYLTEVFDNAKH